MVDGFVLTFTVIAQPDDASLSGLCSDRPGTGWGYRAQ